MNADYSRIETAIHFIEEHASEQPSLEEVARASGLSSFHFQRLFRRWAGISPKRFLQFITVEHAKRLLAESTSVMETAFEVGLSSPSRLHDHFVALEAMTPGEFKSRAGDLEIRWGLHDCPFGPALLAITERGICGLRFESEAEGDAGAWLERHWPGATHLRDQDATAPVVDRIFGSQSSSDEPLPVLVHGTNFQVAVWRALLDVPSGSLVAYDQVARSIGRPTSSRAVGSAVGANRVAFLIPCHRVIRRSGALGGYAWGETRKRAIIGWESSRSLSGAELEAAASG